MTVLASDPNVDVVVIGLTGAVGAMTDNLAADIRQLADTSPVPLVATWNSYQTDEPGFRDLVASGVPLFRSFRNCFGALRAWQDRAAMAASYRERVMTTTVVDPQSPVALALAKNGVLDSASSRALLEGFGIRLPGEALAPDPDSAAKVATGLGFPVVLKVASADIPHKSDLGLVRLCLPDATSVREAAVELLERVAALAPHAVVDGILVQQQVIDGVEMIVGVTHDPVLGPAVTVGTGGIFAEVLRDAATRPLPLDRADAREMVEGLRGYRLLTGARGRAVANVEALLEVIEAVARLAWNAGPRLLELDLNPVVVTGESALAVDSLIVLSQ